MNHTKRYSLSGGCLWFRVPYHNATALLLTGRPCESCQCSFVGYTAICVAENIIKITSYTTNPWEKDRRMEEETEVAANDFLLFIKITQRGKLVVPEFPAIVSFP